jgi:enoyl-CoA hydratase
MFERERQMSEPDSVLVERDGPITIVSINRPHCRNAVDGATARKLYDAFLAFDADKDASVAVFTGTGGYFCAGADLKAVASGDPNKKREVGGHNSIAPMGPSRLRLTKPVIAAVEGFAVAGGMELALWADMRVVAEDATFGVFCRRFGVPLIDLGTIRLPRLIGHSQAIDLILTGRAVGGPEALRMGLANRLVPKGEARAQAIALAKDIARFPQNCPAPTGCRHCGSGICRKKRLLQTKCAAGSKSSRPGRLYRARRDLPPASAATARLAGTASFRGASALRTSEFGLMIAGRL